MRILLVPNSYPPVLGGLQTVAHRLACGLARRGHEVRAVTNRYPRSLPSAERRDGVPVRRWLFLTPGVDHLRRGRFDLFAASFYYYPRTLLRFRRLLRAFGPDVVNVHFPHTQIPFILWLRRRFSFRLVVSLHGDEVERWRAEGKARGNPDALKSILLEADAVTACSQYLLDEASKLVPQIRSKGSVIHNGIDAHRFRNGQPYEHPRPYALAYGRLTHKKGFDLLLEAWAQARPANEGIDLLVAGGGEEAQNLHAQARRLGLDDRVHFLGRAAPEEVTRLLKGARFVTVPSRREPFGIVALEALAAGKPLLAADVGGLPELIADVDDCAGHRLVPPTAEALAGGLREMIGQNWPENSHGADSLPETFAWTSVVHRYETLLSPSKSPG